MVSLLDSVSAEYQARRGKNVTEYAGNFIPETREQRKKWSMFKCCLTEY